MTDIFNQLVLAVLCLLICSVHAALPYNPSRAFALPPNNSHIAYFFLPKASGSSAFQLLGLEASKSFDGAKIPFSTLSPSLPFIKDGVLTAFTPIVDAAGNLSVHAGRCSSKTTDSSLWDYRLEGESGRWVERHAKPGGAEGGDILSGANFLAAGISFSSNVGTGSSSSKAYIFGGMCPGEQSSTNSWTTSANYSNSLLTLTSSPKQQSSEYTLSTSKAKGPPVAEAGFSVTPLLPSILKSASSVQGQQQNFVLLGGHTENAFINTSQVALLSLPEESWTFLPVITTTPNTDLLARRGVAEVEPRSGHTAILTGDGKKIIVFGGWVGDINTPADPQLAILEVGEGYGGTGDWRWDVPAQKGTGLPQGQGIYGHAAVLLPGDVMMVVGGYSITGGGKSRSKRADQVSNTKSFFYNTTSNAWITSYNHPAEMASTQSKATKSGSGTNPSKKAAVGSGVALGILVLIVVVLLGIWYSRRAKRHQREAREKSLRQLSFTAQRFDSSDEIGYGGIDGRGGEKSAVEWMEGRERGQQGMVYSGCRDPKGGSGPSTYSDNGVTEAERTGLLVEIPSPTRGLRRSLHSRPRSGERLLTYQAAPGLDDSRRSLAGSIHPIDERAEYEQPFSEGTTAIDADQTPIASTPPIVDPFRDPQPLSSHPILTPVAPTSPARERELEIQEWVTDWAAAEALIHRSASSAKRSTHSARTSISPDRRSSPERAVDKNGDRTSSNLSERSIPSTVSALSIQPTSSLGTLSRSVSQRSAALLTSVGIPNPFSSVASSPTFDQPGSPGRISPQTRYTHSISQASRRESTGANSFATARTTFPQLQTEGETLLPRPHAASPPDSPTKHRPVGRIYLGDATGGRRSGAAGGWIGSVRRALPIFNTSAAAPRGAQAAALAHPGNRHSAAPSPHDADYEACPAPNVPRRAASAATDYWRRKQGAADWDAERSVMGGGSTAGESERSYGEGDEWDVEAAVERRVVQVMFTVPREKLRVVNGDGEETDLVSEEGEGERRREEKGKGKEVLRD